MAQTVVQVKLFNFTGTDDSVSNPSFKVYGGSRECNGTVTLDAAAGPVGMDIALSSSDASVNVPVWVHVSEGDTVGMFQWSTDVVPVRVNVMVNADGLYWATTNVDVNPMGVAVLRAPSSRLDPGSTVTMTVKLQGSGVYADQDVDLAINDHATFQGSGTMVDTVTIPAGSNSATFNVVVDSGTNGSPFTVTASFNGSDKVAVFLCYTYNVKVSTSVASVIGGNNLQGTVTLNTVAACDTTVSVSLSNPYVTCAKFPGDLTTTTVIIPAGSKTANITISTTSVTRPRKVTFSGTLHAVVAKKGFDVFL